MYTELRYDDVGDVGVITIDRPDARNALTFTTYAELADAVQSTSARCLVITGADPAFCSGDDVKQVMVAASGALPDTSREPRLTPAAGALLRTDVPVIAAVNGAAVGWGMELALMADLRVASERARFGELFVKRGLCCDVAGLARLTHLVGRERSAELLFTGRIVDAPEAERLGLVSRSATVCDVTESEDRARLLRHTSEVLGEPDIVRHRCRDVRPVGAGRCQGTADRRFVSSPDEVASVVVDAIRRDRAEVIVNSPPVRPLVVLANVVPSLTPRLLCRFGYTGTFERVIASGVR